MAVPAFQNLPLADRDRAWDGDSAEKRVRRWAGAEDGPNAKYLDPESGHLASVVSCLHPTSDRRHLDDPSRDG